MTIRGVLQLENPLPRDVAEAGDDPSVGAAFLHMRTMGSGLICGVM